MFHLIQKKNIERTNWYHSATPEDRREYDAFGPWLMEVKTESEMPRCFLSFYEQHKDAQFLIKVPRNAERRMLRPGMDLYTSLVAVHDQGVNILTNQHTAVLSQDLGWDDIVAIRTSKNLLLGQWSLLMRNGPPEAEIDYNTVSADLMDKATAFVRSRCVAASPAAQHPAKHSPVVVDEPYFSGQVEWEQDKATPSAVPIHFERPNLPCREEATGRRRLSTGLLILDSDDELIVIDRDVPMRRRFQAVHGIRRTYMPYGRIDSFTLLTPPEDLEGTMHILVLTLDQQIVGVPCLKIPEAVIETLKARGIHQAEG